MPTNSNAASLPSVFAGDVISITPQYLVSGTMRAWWWLLLGTFFIGTAVAHFQFDAPNAGIYFWSMAAGLGFVSIWQAALWLRNARMRTRLEEIEQSPALTDELFAWRLWHRGLCTSMDRPFDASSWIARVGPDGPRTVLVGVELPKIAIPEDANEEVPVGLDGPVSSAERATRWMQVGVFGMQLLLAVVMIGTSTGPYRLVMLGIWGICISIALYRLGLRPVRLGASSAAPGMVLVTRWGDTRQFLRADSVLVLLKWGEQVMASVHRADGASIRFTFMGGASDPGLSLLVGRWCMRPARRASEPTQPASAPPLP